MIKNIFGIVMAVVVFSGCAAFRAQNCSEKAGYQNGLIDAKAGRPMSLQNYSVICGKKSAALAEKGYKEGYMAAGEKDGAQMNVTFEGSKLGLVGAYSCKATFQGREFDAVAATEVEAGDKALEKCRAEFPACTYLALTCLRN
ncbi:MAG: hypothetical protein CVT66_10930 [Actinobacteria bacterium HGW-Actinobacteria-6]|nr:MAG: hypothetical protein CVT66_10930 [Actinobacteria bacterium HGW-Actinobacteria-6]